MNVIGISEYRENNLRKLAAFLLEFPHELKLFDMARYRKTISCGTAGCAVGWAPVALNLGLECVINDDDDDAYTDFCRQHLLELEFYDRHNWSWCFSAKWSYTGNDNTPEGAAKRIIWLLDRGLPCDWKEQMNGRSPLCYLDYNPTVELNRETTQAPVTPTNLMICCAADK